MEPSFLLESLESKFEYSHFGDKYLTNCVIFGTLFLIFETGSQVALADLELDPPAFTSQVLGSWVYKSQRQFRGWFRSSQVAD